MSVLTDLDEGDCSEITVLRHGIMRTWNKKSANEIQKGLFGFIIELLLRWFFGSSFHDERVLHRTTLFFGMTFFHMYRIFIP
jgi:hypothetical protein